jgi:hypothetical protein
MKSISQNQSSHAISDLERQYHVSTPSCQGLALQEGRLSVMHQQDDPFLVLLIKIKVNLDA